MSLLKKGERLATALYLVTNFLSDNEPLKFRLRSLSLDLVQKAGFVRYGSGVSEKSVFEEVQGVITETLALLELAFIAGIVSEMNFTILKREYTSLRDGIEIKKVSRESRTDSVLGDTFFGSSFAESFSAQPKIGIQGLTLRTRDQGEPSEPTYTTRNPIGHSKGQKDNTVSDRMSDTKVSPVPSIEPIQNSKFDIQSSVQKEARRTRILKLVKDNREVTIKDIANHFPELSEKTIQRELVSLTEAGVLKKFGERRWSRYALA